MSNPTAGDRPLNPAAAETRRPAGVVRSLAEKLAQLARFGLIEEERAAIESLQEGE